MAQISHAIGSGHRHQSSGMVQTGLNGNRGEIKLKR